MIPLKNSDCVILIPTHKTSFSELELYCLNRTISVLKNWDIFFLIPESADIGCIEDFPVNSIRMKDENFGRIDRYNRWLLSADFYQKFIMYERVMICHSDAITIRDELSYWVEKDIHYVGAPWFNSLIFTPNFATRPELNVGQHSLNVGNGGFSLRNPRKFLEIISRHNSLIKEFCLNTGSNCNEDGFLAYIGLIDPRFKVADHETAVRFSLELNARNQIELTGVLPMGFHAMYKYDPEFWMQIFPDSPPV